MSSISLVPIFIDVFNYFFRVRKSTYFGEFYLSVVWSQELFLSYWKSIKHEMELTDYVNNNIYHPGG